MTFFREEAFSPVWNPDYNYELAQTELELTLADLPEEGYPKEDHKLYISNFRNWVYRSGVTVTVYANGIEIDSANYTVDYVNGRIIFADAYALTLTDYHIITASFTSTYVNITDAYPEELDTNPGNFKIGYVRVPKN